MMVIIAVVVAFCVTILYVDGKVIDAQNDYISECLKDQENDIKALWLMSDCFKRRMDHEYSGADKQVLHGSNCKCMAGKEQCDCGGRRTTDVCAVDEKSR
jgi:hypothetical protein